MPVAVSSARACEGPPSVVSTHADTVPRDRGCGWIRCRSTCRLGIFMLMLRFWGCRRSVGGVGGWVGGGGMHQRRAITAPASPAPEKNV